MKNRCIRTKQIFKSYCKKYKKISGSSFGPGRLSVFYKQRRTCKSTNQLISLKYQPHITVLKKNTSVEICQLDVITVKITNNKKPNERLKLFCRTLYFDRRFYNNAYVLFGRKLCSVQFLTVFYKIRKNPGHLRAILVEVYKIRSARVRSATWIRHESEYSQIQHRNVHKTLEHNNLYVKFVDTFQIRP